MKTPRADYTLEFKKEAVRLVQGGQRQSEAGASLGISGQTLGNWIKPSVPMTMRHRPAGSLPLRAEVTASDGYAHFES